MPIKNGIEVAREILFQKELGNYPDKMMVVMLTGENQKEMERMNNECCNLFDEIIQKPFSMK